MNVVFVMNEVFRIANSVVGESSLPDFFRTANHGSEGMRVSALDELDGVFESDVVGWS